MGSARNAEAVNPFATTSVFAPQLRRDGAHAQHPRASFPRASFPLRLGRLCLCQLRGARLVGSGPTGALPAALPCGGEPVAPAITNRQTGCQCIKRCRDHFSRGRTNNKFATNVMSNASALVTYTAQLTRLVHTRQHNFHNHLSTILSYAHALGSRCFRSGGCCA